MTVESWKEFHAQTIHILKKDARHTRMELGLLAGLLGVFGFTHGRFPSYPAWALLGVGAAYLIARLVHAEPVPGDAQFWITRPYRRSSLVAAKILFVLLFINIPVCLVQMTIFLSQGFGLRGNLAGILWAQCLLMFLVSLPITALASLTRTIGGFALCGVVLAGAVLGLRVVTGPVPDLSLDPLWLRLSLPALLLAVTSVAVLWLQYGQRRTRTSQALAGASAAVVLLALLLVPARVDATLRAWTIPDLTESGGTELRIRVDPLLMSRSPSRFLESGQVEIEVPLDVSSERDDLFLDVVRRSIELVGADGERIASGTNPSSRPEHSARSTLYERLDRETFEAYASRPVVLKAVLDVVLLGDAEERVLDASENGLDLADVRCSIQRAAPTEKYEYLECRSPFRWPALWIQTDFAGNGLRSLRGDLSYSPFPGGPDLNRVESDGVARTQGPPRDVRLVTRRPVGRLHREFETEIDLRDFVVE